MDPQQEMDPQFDECPHTDIDLVCENYYGPTDMIVICLDCLATLGVNRDALELTTSTG